MRIAATTLLALLTLTAAASRLGAQSVAASGHFGTLGLGADVTLGLTSRLAIRGGANFQPWEPSHEFDDIDFTLDLPTPAWTAFVDVYLAGPLRATGGFVLFGSDTEIRGEPTQPVEIGNTTYSPQQIGTLTGVFETRDFAPYAGLGLSKPPGPGFGITFDLGVAFQGEPGVRLSASGPLASNPAFQADLAREEQNIQDDASEVKFYPVLTLGIVFGF